MNGTSVVRLADALGTCTTPEAVFRAATEFVHDSGTAPGVCVLQLDARSDAIHIIGATGSCAGLAPANDLRLPDTDAELDATAVFADGPRDARVHVIPLSAQRCRAVLAALSDGASVDADPLRLAAGLCGLALDRVLADKAADNARRELKAVRAKNGFLIRGVTHDLKNPIGAVDGYLQLLEAGVRGELSEGQREWTARIGGALQRMLALLNDLLDLARIDSGALQVDLHPMPFGAVLREALEAMRPAAAAAQVEVESDVSPTLPAVNADLSRTRQAVDKMLFHALRMAAAGTRIRVSAVAGQNGPRPGEWVALGVHTTGKDVDAEARSKALEGLVKLEVAEDRDPGTGLELAIARRLARAMNGDVAFVVDHDGADSPAALTLWLPVASA